MNQKGGDPKYLMCAYGTLCSLAQSTLYEHWVQAAKRGAGSQN